MYFQPLHQSSVQPEKRLRSLFAQAAAAAAEQLAAVVVVQVAVIRKQVFLFPPARPRLRLALLVSPDRTLAKAVTVAPVLSVHWSRLLAVAVVVLAVCLAALVAPEVLVVALKAMDRLGLEEQGQLAKATTAVQLPLLPRNFLHQAAVVAAV